MEHTHHTGELLELLLDPAHWQFEIIATIILDGIFVALVLPFWHKFHKHHKEDDERIARIEQHLSL